MAAKKPPMGKKGVNPFAKGKAEKGDTLSKSKGKPEKMCKKCGKPMSKCKC